MEITDLVSARFANRAGSIELKALRSGCVIPDSLKQIQIQILLCSNKEKVVDKQHPTRSTHYSRHLSL